MGFRGIPGHEFVGVVDAAPDAPAWVGRRVVGEINAACGRCQTCRNGLGLHCPNRTVLGIVRRPGAHAEWLTLPLENLHAVPEAVSDVAATFVEPLAAAFEPLRQGVVVEHGTSALVLGDGKLGLLQARVLALAGADVTLVGRHGRKLALARQWGLRTHCEDDGPWPDRVPLVAECTGTEAGLRGALAAVRPRGTIILKSTLATPLTVDLAPLVVDEVTVVGSRCGPFPEALAARVAGMVDVSALVDAEMPLSRGPEAFTEAERPGVLKVLLRP
jgi:alcohol dehydrogenase